MSIPHVWFFSLYVKVGAVYITHCKAPGRGIYTVKAFENRVVDYAMIKVGTAPDRRYSGENEPRAGRVATITGEQIRAARALLRWEQTDLAEASGLSVITIKTVEKQHGPILVRTSSLYALQKAFDRAGVEFFDEDNHAGAGVRWKGRRR